MARNDSAGETAPAPIGPVRYTLVILAKNNQGEETGEAVTMVVNGLALPRPGDRLYFDAGGTSLAPVVQDVGHWFFPADSGPRYRELMVTAEVSEGENATVRQLLNRENRERWIARFSMLESDLDWPSRSNSDKA